MSKRIRDLANEDLLRRANELLPPEVFASLLAEDATDSAEADARICAVMSQTTSSRGEGGQDDDMR